VDPLQSGDGAGTGQGCEGEGRRPYGARQCLLKGCENWFQPAFPQARYCSPECRRAACQWRRWRASRQYRTTPQGKERRQAQGCRYRERQRSSRRTGMTATDGAPCEGQRAAEIPEDFRKCSCDRPGCYELFVRQPRSPQQHFCSEACRQALRRVRQRERRLRARRRRGIRRRGGASRETP
jgi:hypothetical protein